MNKKSQFSSLDLIFALFIFLMVLVSLFFNYDSISDKISYDDVNQDMNLILTYATESLMSTAGEPANWDLLFDFNTSSIKALGLFVKPGVLSENKLEYFLTLNGSNYTSAKTILGILGPGYEFGFDLYYYNGTSYNLNNTFGGANLSATKVLISQRNFILDNSTKTQGYVRFYLTK